MRTPGKWPTSCCPKRWPGCVPQTASGTETPDEFADRATRVAQSRGADEITEVAEAFAEVHRAAVFYAAEQALERASLGAMFAAQQYERNE